MAADDRQLERRKFSVEIGDRPPAHQRQRTAGRFKQARERIAQVGGHMHRVRRGCDVDQRAVEIQEQRGLLEIERGEIADRCVIGERRHRACTSTSPSTPVTTLNSR